MRNTEVLPECSGEIWPPIISRDVDGFPIKWQIQQSPQFACEQTECKNRRADECIMMVRKTSAIILQATHFRFPNLQDTEVLYLCKSLAAFSSMQNNYYLWRKRSRGRGLVFGSWCSRAGCSAQPSLASCGPCWWERWIVVRNFKAV